ncbi:MAG: hypothetical protein MZV63_65730 [Marinilabiliales bacterium]|nr:hypothetical protein [Marinilabiliales bacterium]
MSVSLSGYQPFLQVAARRPSQGRPWCRQHRGGLGPRASSASRKRGLGVQEVVDGGPAQLVVGPLDLESLPGLPDGFVGDTGTVRSLGQGGRLPLDAFLDLKLERPRALESFIPKGLGLAPAGGHLAAGPKRKPSRSLRSRKSPDSWGAGIRPRKRRCARPSGRRHPGSASAHALTWASSARRRAASCFRALRPGLWASVSARRSPCPERPSGGRAGTLRDLRQWAPGDLFPEGPPSAYG